MEIKDRIKLIMQQENIPAAAFADSIGVQQSTLSHAINGRNKPSLDVIMKIHQKYNYINLNWLLYGIEEMITTNSEKNSDTNNTPSLFSQNFEKEEKTPKFSQERSESPLKSVATTQASPAVIQEIKYIEKPSRKIVEIRIFFDDNTYEIFKSEK